ncbi:MAG: hypothetical protein WAV67_11185 [Dokdonella sp.]
MPPNSGLEWSYHEGPDFDVCYASFVGGGARAFGVYLGNFPSFSPEHATVVGNGKIAGRKVKWYRQETADDSSSLARQTLLTLDEKSGYVAHIWVTADTEQQLKDRLAILERITFKH